MYKKIKVWHAPYVDQVADAFTKAILSSQFLLMRNKLRVEDLATLSLRRAIKSNDQLAWLGSIYYN